MKKLFALLTSLALLVFAFSACQQQTAKDDGLVIENNYLAAECSENKMTSDGTGLYFCYSPYSLHYIDTDTQKASILCSKPDCPHYVENPGMESLDCFAQMIYDGGGDLYYYQEKLYYTILGNNQTAAILAQANPTGTETKTLIEMQDALSDDIDAFLSANPGAVVTGISPQILGAHSGKLYLHAVITYTVSQNGASSDTNQSVLLSYDCASGSVGRMEKDEIKTQLENEAPVSAVLCGSRMICLFTLVDKTREDPMASQENSYRLVSVDLDSQQVDKALDFEGVGILEPHITQSGDFYLTEAVWNGQNQMQVYHEYNEALEKESEYTLNLSESGVPWRLEKRLICTNGVLLDNGEFDPEKSEITVIDLETQESKTETAPYSLGILGDVHGKVLANREMTQYFLLDETALVESPETVPPSPVEGLLVDPYISFE